VRRTPQTINVALVPTVTSLAAVDAPDTQILIDGAWTGIASSTGVLDVSWETEQDFRSGEKLTAPGKGRVASDTPSSETVATASFEPIAPSRLHKILNRMSPARVVHRHEKVGFIPAKPIHEATPRAPLQLMRGARGQVSADIRVTIDKRGKVTSVNLEPAAEKGPLPEAAMAAAWNWTFTPARKGSNPVESQANLHFRFQNPEFASANR
jgi:TonB family protein